VYAYGAYYYDENGNGVVFPLDLQGFNNRNAVISSNYGEATRLSYNSVFNYTLYNYTGSPLQGGDRVRINGTIYTVVKLDGNGLFIAGNTITSATGTLELLVGDGANRSSSWCWRYPTRQQHRYTILDDDSNVSALGLRLEISNHPEWAVGMKIVRQKRKKNILHQMPHIPTMAVMGSYETNQFHALFSDELAINDSEYDHIYPKVFGHGVAKNFGAKHFWELASDGGAFPTFEIRKYMSPIKVMQSGRKGLVEVPYTIFGLFPEYLYQDGIDGQAWDFRELSGFNVEVIDAIGYTRQEKYKELFSDADQANAGRLEYNSPVNLLASVYPAITKDNYLYSRSNGWRIGFDYQYGGDINDLIGLGYLYERSARIEDSVPIPLTQSFSELDRSPFDAESLNKITRYGATQQLAKVGVDRGKNFLADVFPFFDLNFVNQKGVVLHLDKKIEDFSRYVFEQYLGNQWKLFVNLPEPSEIVYRGYPEGLRDDLTVSLNDITFVVDQLDYDAPDLVPDGEFAGAAYIMNVTRGLGDNRYGNIDDPAEWYDTDFNIKINSTDQLVVADVFGGDCHVSRHQFKIHEETPRLYRHRFGVGVDDGTWDVLPTTDVMIPEVPVPVNYIGTFEKNIEVIDLYLESEIHGSYEKKVGKYPVSNEGNLSEFEGKWDYEYNFGYSVFNQYKVHVNDVRLCVTENDWSNSIAWSDRKVRGSIGALFTDLEGLNMYRVNNILVLDGKFGTIKALKVLDDKSLHVFQENRVAYIPVGVDEIRTQDGQLIAVGTGQVLGAGNLYLPYEHGVDNLHAVAFHNGQFFFVDSEARAIISMSSRGSNFKVLSKDGFELPTQEFLEGAGQVRVHIDEAQDRVIFYARGKGEALVFGTEQMRFETILQAKFNGAHSLNDVSYWIHKEHIYKAYAGPRGAIFDEVEGKVVFVVNDQQDMTKIFKVVTANASERPSAIRCLIYNDGSTQPDQETEKLPWSKMRNKQYFFNQLRDRRGTYSRKMFGQYMVVEVYFEGSDKLELNSVVTEYRKSY